MTKKGFKRARQALGKTQREMAKDLNLSESFIRHVENRRQLPSLENAVRISLYLGEPIETVFYDFSDVFSEYAKKFLRSS